MCEVFPAQSIYRYLPLLSEWEVLGVLYVRVEMLGVHAHAHAYIHDVLVLVLVRVLVLVWVWVL